MSQFSEALAAALADTGLSQADLCASTKIGQSPMSRYVRGTAPIGRHVVAKIAAQLPERHAARIVAAYLRDEAPDEFRHLVTITPTDGALQETPYSLPEDLSDDLRSLIAYFARKAVTHTQVRDMLDNIRTALESE